MRYPVLIEPKTDNSDYGVMVVDFPGCFSAGDTLDEALTNAEESAAAWIDATIEDGDAIPPPSTSEKVREIEPDWIIAYINVDPALLDDTTERVNITMPRRVLRRLDDLAKSAGESRSGYIAAMTLRMGKA
jgi:predicted RNase H-like HicB family nuclease